ncbi:M28 family peptidase [Clostridium disporicum]|uniref:Vacuolar membrane protease n=1 Tax=Clostridium disporicum TaxID=84024 RepID=A0A174D9M2_9CLOT|nr:M28 family peptidase [Clostridium disporicum]MDU6340083.1 M20/M25/M40 family metallo-hydrolase [Clostridium sp.]CUO22183.1 putative aminopeptidase [Clostridium disporicum]
MRNKGIILFLSIILSIVLGVTSLYTPRPKSEDSGFSTEIAKEHIKEISKEVHSIQEPEALGRVREYILNELKELGLEPEVFTYEGVESSKGGIYDINNIYAKIDGKNGEDGSYIMLASHYDSSPKKRSGEDGESKGAADAGYGVSTILEIVRIIKESGQELENGIKILITDGEEMGLMGAKEEMNNNFDLYENVNFVVNLEARGIKGPALMFETSNNNKKVIDLYKKANLPVSYSLAADVYNKMPNGSDFTEFKNAGLPGINFAVLNDLDYYHTKNDNYDNISDTSIQHYGEQVLPIVQEYVYNAKYGQADYFQSNQNSVFFTLLPNVFINYTSLIATILAVISLIALVVIMRNLKVNAKMVVKWIAVWTGLALASTAIGIAISYIISMVSGIEFKITYMPRITGSDFIVLMAVILTSVLVVLLSKKLAKNREDLESMLFGGLWFNEFLLVIFMIALPGGSYLFLWPVIMTLISIILTKKFKNQNMLLIATMFTIVMYVPVIYNIYIALTIGALGVVMLLTLMSLSTIVPLALNVSMEKENVIRNIYRKVA